MHMQWDKSVGGKRKNSGAGVRKKRITGEDRDAASKGRETENRRGRRALAVCEGNEERALGFTSRCEARWRTTRNTLPENWGSRVAWRKQNEASGCTSHQAEGVGNRRGWGLLREERSSVLSEWSRIGPWRRQHPGEQTALCLMPLHSPLFCIKWRVVVWEFFLKIHFKAGLEGGNQSHSLMDDGLNCVVYDLEGCNDIFLLMWREMFLVNFENAVINTVCRSKKVSAGFEPLAQRIFLL